MLPTRNHEGPYFQSVGIVGLVDGPGNVGASKGKHYSFPRAHGSPAWLARHQQEERAVLSREEEDFSQAPAELDEWEPA